MIFSILSLFVFIIHASAMDVECKQIPEYQMKMDVHASNYLNAETTRTPNGGAYKYKEVACQKVCKITEHKKFIGKYLPNHPDANKNGFVSYPHISKEIEKSFISTYAKSLIMVSKVCPTQVKVLEIKNGPAVMMKYSEGNIVSDTINFETNGGVISWVRQTKDGNSRIINL